MFNTSTNSLDYIKNLSTRELMEGYVNGEIPIERTDPYPDQSKYYFIRPRGKAPENGLPDVDYVSVPDGVDPLAFKEAGYQVPTSMSSGLSSMTDLGSSTGSVFGNNTGSVFGNNTGSVFSNNSGSVFGNTGSVFDTETEPEEESTTTSFGLGSSIASFKGMGNNSIGSGLGLGLGSTTGLGSSTGWGSPTSAFGTSTTGLGSSTALGNTSSTLGATSTGRGSPTSAFGTSTPSLSQPQTTVDSSDESPLSSSHSVSGNNPSQLSNPLSVGMGSPTSLTGVSAPTSQTAANETSSLPVFGVGTGTFDAVLNNRTAQRTLAQLGQPTVGMPQVSSTDNVQISNDSTGYYFLPHEVTGQKHRFIIGESKPEYVVHFNGRQLNWFDEKGNLLHSFPAMSGHPNYQRRSEQSRKNLGPLPEGEWIIPWDKYEEYGMLNKIKDWWKYDEDNPRSDFGPGWGKERVKLIPDPNTEMYGRSGLYIHGGDVLGSAGCLDLAGAMPEFAKYFRENGKDLRLIVDYGNGGLPE